MSKEVPARWNELTDDPLVFGEAQTPSNPLQARVISSMTNVENHTRPRTRLNPDAREKLRVVLCGMFDHIVNQGVPERFVKLVDRIDEHRNVQSEGGTNSVGASSGTASGTSEPSEQFVSPAVDKRPS